MIHESVESQQCKLCQHSIDTPPITFTIGLLDIVTYQAVIQILPVLYSTASLYLIPQLRAPPFFNS